MVREYATELYRPAAAACRLLGDVAGGVVPAAEPSGSFAGAAELAAWKQRVTAAWEGVRVELVETDDGDPCPGERLNVRAGVALGELSPQDVRVEVIYGRVGDDDEIADPARAELTLEARPGADSVAWYSGTAVLGLPGPFGYTVRVLPSHPYLAAPAEMGLVTLPAATAGMISGDLR
jgi:glycogen phosphorylase